MATNWQDLGTIGPLTEAFTTSWRLLCEQISGVTQLKFVVEGSWTIIPGLDLPCAADGQPLLALADSATYLPGCPAGALLGKLGGSSADTSGTLLSAPASATTPSTTPTQTPPATGEVAGGTAASTASQSGMFVIGTTCVLPVTAVPQGPLFIGFNIRSRPIALTNFKIQVWGAPQS